MLKRLFALMLLLIVIGINQAQVRKVRIASITVDGNKTAEASTIRLNSGLMVGQEIMGEDLQKAIKNLWSIGIFSDVQIFATDQTYNGLDLLIKVKEYPTLRKVELIG